MEIQRKNFVRKIENFTCESCGYSVEGNGYTDHCPMCLYGKHVDEEIPGDRKSLCGGLFEPVGTRVKGDKKQIKYRCQKCNEVSYCKLAKDDDFDVFLFLMKETI